MAIGEYFKFDNGLIVNIFLENRRDNYFKIIHSHSGLKKYTSNLISSVEVINQKYSVKIKKSMNRMSEIVDFLFFIIIFPLKKCILDF